MPLGIKANLDMYLPYVVLPTKPVKPGFACYNKSIHHPLKPFIVFQKKKIYYNLCYNRKFSISLQGTFSSFRYYLTFLKEKSVTASQSFATVFFSFIGKEVPINPVRIPGKIIILCTCMTGALLVWSYSACLVSFLTVDTIIFPIANVKVSSILLSLTN